MIPRHSQILQSLRKKGHCSVEELCLKFAVSDMTIRRDLHALENSGHVLRTHGGAALAERVAFEFGFLERSMAHRAAKRAIAAAAFAELGRTKTILVDSGTTTLALAEHLRGSTGLTVSTTSLPIASALQFSGYLLWCGFQSLHQLRDYNILNDLAVLENGPSDRLKR